MWVMLLEKAYAKVCIKIDEFILKMMDFALK